MTFPVTWIDVENVFEPSMVKLKPVIAVAVMGETAMLPVITELGTVEIPVLARMTKLLAVVPRSTLVVVPLVTLTMAIAESKNRFKFMLDWMDGMNESVLVFCFVRFIFL